MSWLPSSSAGTTADRSCRRLCSRSFLHVLLAVLLIAYIWFRIVQVWTSVSPVTATAHRQSVHFPADGLLHARTVLVPDHVHTHASNPRCTHYTCFDVYRCDTLTRDRISVFVYPLERFIDNATGTSINERMSRQFRQMLQAIADSPYFTPDPDQACLLVPSLDLLTQASVRLEDSSRALAILSHWNASRSTTARFGANHLIFNFIPGSYPSYARAIEVDTADAMIAGGGYDSWSFRSGFDVAIPVFSSFSDTWRPLDGREARADRPYLLTSTQFAYSGDDKKKTLIDLQTRHADQLLLVSERCRQGSRAMDSTYVTAPRCLANGVAVAYPDILTSSSFCLILPTAHLATPLLPESLMTGCIPVIVADDMVLPFEEKIDWKRGSIRVREDLLPDVMAILSGVSRQRMAQMRSYGMHVYQKYMKTVSAIALTTLDIINDRLIPLSVKRKDNDARCHDSDL